MIPIYHDQHYYNYHYSSQEPKQPGITLSFQINAPTTVL